MKSGFYLRPDGKEILYLSKIWRRGFNISFSIYTIKLMPVNVKYLFGNWIYLGE